MINIEVKGRLKDIYDIDRRLQKRTEVLSRELQALALAEIKQTVRDENLVATKSLLKSVSTSFSRVTSGYRVGVGSSHPGAEAIEKGRRKGAAMPPVAKILRWMIARGIEGGPRIAFVIARSISRKGIKATNVFSKAAERIKNKIPAFIRKISLRLE